MRLDPTQEAPELGGATRLYTRGKYRVFAELARGGMSVVYLAYVEADARRTGAIDVVVLKELRSELAADPGVLAMFVEEGRLAARLAHPNVVRTIDVGSEDGRHYIAMEYLEGKSLQRVLSRAKRDGAALGLDFLGSVVCDILEGLAHAHAAVDRDGSPLGIVHRDVSPHNVLVGFDGRVKVLDFGIAKAAHSGIHTRTGILKGKVAYMSPEQAAGTDVDPRSDVFAVGVMLWEVVVGQRFWEGTTGETQILHALWQGKRSPELEAAVARAPAVLRPVIARSIAMERSERYATAQEMLADLRAALVVCGATPFGPRGVARVMCDRFGDDRVRLKTAIEEALAIHRRASGEYPVSELAPPSSDAGGDALSSLRPAPVPASVEAPRVASKPAGREALVAEAERIAREVARLHEGERAGALPPSVAAIARAVHTAGGVEPAAALETLSAFMQVVDDLEQWQRSAVAHLQAGARDAPGEAWSDRSIATPAPDTVRPYVLGPSEEPRLALPPWVEGATPFKLGAAAAVGAAIAIALLPGLSRAPPRSALASASSSPPAAAAPALERAADDVVHLIVRATPAHARIVIDHEKVFDTPCVTTLPRDGAAHTAHVEADGYEPADQAFAAGDDLAILVSLQPKGPRSTTQAHPAAAPPAGPAAPGPPRD